MQFETKVIGKEIEGKVKPPLSQVVVANTSAPEER